MNYLKRHKELIPILAIAIALGFASYDLFGDQHANSELINSGTTIAPTTLSGRAACEVPIPDVSGQNKSDTLSFESNELN